MTTRTKFHVTFKNVPYTDEEWARQNQWREECRNRSPYYFSRHPEKVKPLLHRPNHRVVHGRPFDSESEAKAACEKAVAQGKAQFAAYFFWDRAGQIEQWELHKNKNWKQVK